MYVRTMCDTYTAGQHLYVIWTIAEMMQIVESWSHLLLSYYLVGQRGPFHLPNARHSMIAMPLMQHIKWFKEKYFIPIRILVYSVHGRLIFICYLLCEFFVCQICHIFAVPKPLPIPCYNTYAYNIHLSFACSLNQIIIIDSIQFRLWCRENSPTNKFQRNNQKRLVFNEILIFHVCRTNQMK